MLFFVIFHNIPQNFQILDRQVSQGSCLVRMVRMVKDTSESAAPSFWLALNPQCPLDKSTRSRRDKNTIWQQKLNKEHSEKSKLWHGSTFAIWVGQYFYSLSKTPAKDSILPSITNFVLALSTYHPSGFELKFSGYIKSIYPLQL